MDIDILSIDLIEIDEDGLDSNSTKSYIANVL